jgi:hypothetical protein
VLKPSGLNAEDTEKATQGSENIGLLTLIRRPDVWLVLRAHA